MSISDLELAELKSRTANAIRTNSSLANVEGHIETLKTAIGKSRASKVQAQSSPTAYLYQLILQAESKGLEPEPIQVKQPEPAPTIEVVETSEELAEEAPAPEESTPKTSEKPSKGKKDKKDKKS